MRRGGGKIFAATVKIFRVASCRASGGQTSHFGYFQETCGRWLEDTLARLQSLPARWPEGGDRGMDIWIDMDRYGWIWIMG